MVELRNPSLIGGSQPRSSATFPLMLAAQSISALHFKIFDPATNAWGAWVQQPFPANGRPEDRRAASFPMVSWSDTAGWRVNGFFAAENGNPLPAPFWQEAGRKFKFDVHPGPAAGGGFFPETGFARTTSGQWNLHFFGLAAVPGGSALREYWWNSGQWQFVDHGRPGFDAARGMPAPARLHLGQGSSVHTIDSTSHAYIFAVGATDAPQSGRLYLRHSATGSQGSGWDWLPLWKPDNTLQIRSRPLAVKHVVNGHWRVHVFVTALSQADQHFHLYERFSDGNDWSTWSPWQDMGAPPGLSAAAGDPTLCFEMTTAVVWSQGSTLRINLFGCSNRDPQLPEFHSGRLVEFFWDGAAWHWAGSDDSPERRPGTTTPVPIRITSSAVIDEAGRDRVRVVGVSDSGRIWERSWDSAGNWRWAELS